MIGELDSEHIDMVLKTAVVGRLGCCADNMPYIVPLSFVYHDGAIYGHTNAGRKTDMIRSNPRVCFEVDVVESLECWRSVVGWGTWEELKGLDAVRALDLLLDRLAPLSATEPAAMHAAASSTPHGIAENRIRLRSTKGIFFRIRLDTKTGRYERH